MGFDISDIWDKIQDELDYIISGEIFGDAGEFFTGFFDGIEELSIAGVIYGVILVGLVFLFRKQVFTLVHNLPLKILFYIIAFVMGYMMGRKIWE
jgi:hypothetical protein